ncbi:hypothetical protein ACWD3I_08700 [Streptomyces sp. NPDC002817]|uniref:hypothetical protein n=1 Tax=Streptomyces sp. NPDC088357 TaxID=3154655 RepID=UPI0034120B0E
MNIRTRTLVPLTALVATALVPLLPATAQAQAQTQAAPGATVRLPAGYCCQDLALAGDSHVAVVLDHARLTVPADVAVGIGCHPHNFTPEQHTEECQDTPLECVADAEAGRWALIGLGCVPANSSPESGHHRVRPEAVTAG